MQISMEEIMKLCEQNERRPKDTGISTMFIAWKNQCCKDLILLKMICRLNTTSIKIPIVPVCVCVYCVWFNKLILRLIWRCQKSKNSLYTRHSKKERRGVGRFALLDINTWHKAKVMKGSLTWRIPKSTNETEQREEKQTLIYK